MCLRIPVKGARRKFVSQRNFLSQKKRARQIFRLIRFYCAGFFLYPDFSSRLTFFLVALQKPNGSEKALVEELKQLECSRLDVDSRAAANHHRDGDDGSVVITRILPVEKKIQR